MRSVVSTERRTKITDIWSKRASELHQHTNKKDADLEMLGKELAELDKNKKKLRVLCLGAVNCGKSSFVNSLSSALRDKLQSIATSSFSKRNESKESMTEKFQMYRLKYKQKSEMKDSNVCIGDMPGFQESGGIQENDVRYVIQGRVPNKYNMKNGIDESCTTINATPKNEDRMHCVCFVFDLLTSPDKLPSTIENLLKWIQQEDIPVVVIVTKADLISNTVKESTLKVFQSKVVKEKIKKLSDKFSFKPNIMFPVINYVNEEEIDTGYDVLLIAAFKKILSVGMEYLERTEEEAGDTKDRSEADELQTEVTD